MGYCKGDAYRVWLPEKKMIVESKHVRIVQELSQPYTPTDAN